MRSSTEKYIQTVRGPVQPDLLGLTLPHEHLFTDLRGPQTTGYAQASPEEVAAAMLPYLQAAHNAGVSAIVECSTVGVGRNVTILEHLAQATPIHVIAPTGMYREGFIPEALIRLDVEELAGLWVRDLTEGIEGTRVRAGFIKIAMSDDGPTALERRNLKAAAMASQETGAVIASHTASGAVARREMDILEASGLSLERFIWVHANLEPDRALHLAAARRGAIVEFDAVGAAWQDEEAMLEATMSLIKAGLVEQLLLSHDAGWYQPGNPGGQPESGFRGYTSLLENFLPQLRARGATDSILQQITVSNPARVFAFGQG
ncbi:MAG TPA: esterase [Anaerolineae bacterium]|jgi:phosphotriesterase-related protein|nr:esterase [Anaerolineae bacterium]